MSKPASLAPRSICSRQSVWISPERYTLKLIVTPTTERRRQRILAYVLTKSRNDQVSILHLRDKVMSTICSTYSMKKRLDRKSTRLNSSHVKISYAVFCLKKKKKR